MADGELSLEAVRRGLSPEAASAIESLNVIESTGSTNDDLLSANAPSPDSVRVLVAAHQSQGRGRHGRRWELPPEAGICTSVAATYRSVPRHIGALTLQLGLAIAEAIEAVSGAELRLKWPNDLMLDASKIGGILVESRTTGDGALHVVAGCGLNWRLPDGFALERGDGPPPGDLARAVAELPPRAAVAAAVVEAMTSTLLGHVSVDPLATVDGFARRDWLRGRRIRVSAGKRAIAGTAAGIDPDGALRVQTDDGSTASIRSGTVELLARRETP